MEIKREGENLIIKMSSPELAEQVMRLADYGRLLEIMKDVEIPQTEIDKLADEVTAAAWNERQKKTSHI